MTAVKPAVTAGAISTLHSKQIVYNVRQHWLTRHVRMSCNSNDQLSRLQ